MWWVEEAAAVGRGVPLRHLWGRGGESVAAATAPLFSILDGLPAAKDAGGGGGGGGRGSNGAEAGHSEWRYDVDAGGGGSRVAAMLGRGGRELDNNGWRIVAAMQAVVDARELGGGGGGLSSQPLVAARSLAVDGGQASVGGLLAETQQVGERTHARGGGAFATALDSSSDDEGGEEEEGGHRGAGVMEARQKGGGECVEERGGGGLV